MTPAPVQGKQRDRHERRRAERDQRQMFGIERGDDHDGAEIVDDGERGEEHLERVRHPRSEQRQHAKGEGDVGGGGNGPAAPIAAILEVDGHEHERRRQHAAERRDQRQRASRPRVELAFEHLALDLEPDQQEEDGHQAVIDPMQDVEAADLGVQRLRISLGERGIGDGEPKRGTCHQHETARGLELQEALECRSAASRHGRARG